MKSHESRFLKKDCKPDNKLRQLETMQREEPILISNLMSNVSYCKEGVKLKCNQSSATMPQ